MPPVSMIALLSFAGFADISQHYLTIFDRACKCGNAFFVLRFIDIKISILGKENDSSAPHGGPIKSVTTITQPRLHEKGDLHKKRQSSRKVYTKSDIFCKDSQPFPRRARGLLENPEGDDILRAPC